MKAQLRIEKAATASKQVVRGASRLKGGLTLLGFRAFVVWFGISSLQAYGARLGHARSLASVVASLIMVAVASILLVQGAQIAVYIARRSWPSMFRRAFPSDTTQGKQS
ncbi:hypothetical protein SAMN02787142_7954 [Burkholderia sp. WP9]|uniref:hypothetical protein n=1 Tax=Burkholderia sp. WP9 TaxID=1500263 RepID=UPI00089622D2|nr:hypothetical protein [Burkholderia sp. WP9]SEF12965.1 hypothetical protein SAMN02787142_7954 [Burkholderia sp. WP9]